METSRGPSVDSARYLFERDSGGSWSQTGKLVADDAGKDDYFGRAVGISGDVAVVGAEGKNDASGSAYLFDV